MRRHKVIITARARQMVKDHFYFLSRVSLDAAKKLRIELMRDIRSLDRMPERFPLLDPEDPTGFRKMLVAGRYLVLYTIIDDAVYIDLVIDGRQNYQWLIHP